MLSIKNLILGAKMRLFLVRERIDSTQGNPREKKQVFFPFRQIDSCIFKHIDCSILIYSSM